MSCFLINKKGRDKLLSSKYFKHGTLAEASMGTSNRFIAFSSFKKLLGFKDHKQIVFNNKQILKLTGKDLASLLIKNLFEDIKTFFTNNSVANREEYERDGKFNPSRAVVAIPNNFTNRKIQDMLDCIINLRQFKEIRCIYEAEAVLFYYLSDYKRLNNSKDRLEEETILVFDMGGATINATIVKVMLSPNSSKYQIDLLGKIGYGIGGDTIDYCIIKFLLSRTLEFPELKSIGLEENKIQLAKLALEIKMELCANYKDKDFLILAINLERAINANLGLSIKIEENSKTYRYFKRGENGRFKIFDHDIFIDIIYNNIEDSVKEVVDLSGNTQINKVIFSGRSTFFPLVKETVEDQLKVKKGTFKKIEFTLDESKFAVAEGACWYGVNKNAIYLNNFKTNAAFGFKKTLGDKTDVKFYELVKMGSDFNTLVEGKGTIKLQDEFEFDGNSVNFYQVMGKDSAKIFSEDQKHKYSKVASIVLPQATSEIGMKINENDDVECVVRLINSDLLTEKGEIADQEINEENEEHYTWIVK